MTWLRWLWLVEEHRGTGMVDCDEACHECGRASRGGGGEEEDQLGPLEDR